MAGSNFEIGTRVRVKITGEVGALQTDEGRETSMLTTTKINETSSSSQWTHYLFLGSASVTVGPTGTGIRQMATAEFDAEVTGDYEGSKNGTTKVTELSSSGRATGCRHFLYLNSENVVRLDGSYRAPGEVPKLGEKATTTAYRMGDMIRVALDVKFASGAPTGPYGCARANEVNGGKWTHYVFQNSRGVTGSTEKDGLAHVEFNAMIAGEIKGSQAVTTSVVEIDDDGSQGYYHSLYINSPAITRLGPNPEIEPVPVTDKEIAPEPVKLTNAKKGGTTVSIDRYNDEINYRQVEERIEELEENTETEWEVIRVRNDEVLATVADKEDGDQYVTDNDYDPERVIVQETDADEDDVEELGNLNSLDYECGRKFGAAWNAGDVTLYRDDYFNSDWARDVASDELGISVASTSDWPLDQIDWSDAAELKRDADYTLIDFDGAEFYGADQ